MFQSFRVKIVLWFSAIVLATLLLFGLASMGIIHRSTYHELDHSLRAEANWIMDALGTWPENSSDELWSEITHRTRVSPRKQFVEIQNARGDSLYRSPNLEGDLLHSFGEGPFGRAVTIEEFRGEPLRLLEVNDSFHHIVVAYSLADVENSHEEIISSFFLLIPVALLLAGIGGLFLMSRFLRPIRDLNLFADRSLRLPLNQEPIVVPVRSHDEMGMLVTTVTNLSQKMRESMRHTLSFSSLASHELRTPLAVVRNQLEDALHSNSTKEALTEMAVSIYDEILQLGHVIDDLLSLSTVQAGTVRIEKKRVALHTLLQEFCAEAGPLAAAREIAFELRDGHNTFIQADESRIRQMLFNLFDNAVKHTPERGHIYLSDEVEDKEVVLSFADTGSGIEPSNLSRIFEFFYTGTNKREDGQGAGLGLGLVKWVVQSHNGTISVQSELGKGTTFIIRLPIEQPASV